MIRKKKIFNFLFLNNKATIGELSKYTSINENTIRDYLKQFATGEIIERVSNKKRDKNALYKFKRY